MPVPLTFTGSTRNNLLEKISNAINGVGGGGGEGAAGGDEGVQWRAMILTAAWDDLADAFSCFSKADGASDTVVWDERWGKTGAYGLMGKTKKTDAGVALLVPGMGTSVAGKIDTLARQWPGLAETLSAASIDPSPAATDVTASTQLIVAFQVFLAQALARLGVPVAAVLGFSVGEIAASAAAGAITAEQAGRIATAMGKVHADAEGAGRMHVVFGLDRDEALALLEPPPPPPSLPPTIGAWIAPRGFVFTGTDDSMDAVATMLSDKALTNMRAEPFAVPFHWPPYYEPKRTAIVDAFALALETRSSSSSSSSSSLTADASVDPPPPPSLSPTPSLPSPTLFLSQPGGPEVDPLVLQSPDRWADSVCLEALSQPAIDAAIAEKHTVFVELNTVPLYARSATDTAAAADLPSLSLSLFDGSVEREKEEADSSCLLRCLGRLWVEGGVAINWSTVDEGMAQLEGGVKPIRYFAK
jgi:acyl transferase domain-containing protein